MDRKVALYARISKTDKRNGAVSNSISNQIMLMKNHINSFDSVYDTDIYIDDGYSGRDNRRPAFRKLLARIVMGEVQTLIVKDFSRLSRNHILISELTEYLFVDRCIHFISVGDRYDSNDMRQSKMIMNFRTLFNEYYCHDISSKVKSTLEAKKSSGEYAVARAPFGYDKNEQGKIVIDEREACIVKYMYKLKSQGMNYSNIACKLNEEKVLLDSKKTKWYPENVWRILNNPMYRGYHIWHKYSNSAYDAGRSIYLPHDEWHYDSDKSLQIIEGFGDRCENDDRVMPGGHLKLYRKGKRHLFKGITKCYRCRRALVLDRSKKGWLCCRNCSGCENKIIEMNELYVICINQLVSICNSCSELLNEQDYMPVLKIKETTSNDIRQLKEVILNTFIEKIEIDQSGIIKIYWKFSMIKGMGK